jgi:all-trans-8'-apo-beta-carotenal 15,15'-oxygenase
MVSSGVVGEFPRSESAPGLNRAADRPYRRRNSGTALPTGLAVHDWASGRSDAFEFGHSISWRRRSSCPSRMPAARRDAWLVGPTINLRAGVTELHAFDAAHVSDGPVATWAADVALPAGFPRDLGGVTGLNARLRGWPK